MSKHLNPLEKEFLIRQYKSNYRIKMSDFCEANHISTGAFQKWIKQYDEGGLEGLARADSEIKDVLPEGIDRTEESYCRLTSFSRSLHINLRINLDGTRRNQLP